MHAEKWSGEWIGSCTRASLVADPKVQNRRVARALVVTSSMGRALVEATCVTATQMVMSPAIASYVVVPHLLMAPATCHMTTGIDSHQA